MTMPPADPIHIHTFDELDSTGLHARRELAAGRLGDRPVALVAKRQTDGRGRLGRRWESPEGGLWMTACWPIERDRYLAVVDGLGLRIGVACRAAIQRVMVGIDCPARVLLRWPNDVVIDGRKVLGALTEITTKRSRAWILVGVGVNVNVDPAALPTPLQASAGSLHTWAHGPVDPERVRDELLGALAAVVLREGLSESLLAEARDHLASLGEQVMVSMADGGKVAGTLIGLDNRGMGMFEIGGKLYVPPVSSSLVFDAAQHPD